LDRVEGQHSGDVEGEQGERVFERVLLPFRIGAREPQETTFERRHQRRQEVAAAAKDPRDMLTYRHGREDDEGENEQDLQPADKGQGGISARFPQVCRRAASRFNVERPAKA
jgi:hypothetical protein